MGKYGGQGLVSMTEIEIGFDQSPLEYDRLIRKIASAVQGVLPWAYMVEVRKIWDEWLEEEGWILCLSEQFEGAVKSIWVSSRVDDDGNCPGRHGLVAMFFFSHVVNEYSEVAKAEWFIRDGYIKFRILKGDL